MCYPPPNTEEEFNSKLVIQRTNVIFEHLPRSGPHIWLQACGQSLRLELSQNSGMKSHSGKWTSALNQFTETNCPKESVWGKESYFPVCPRLWITGNNVVNDDHRLIFFLHKASIYRQEKKGILFFLPWYAFLTREVLVAADLHFMNHHGVQFELKIVLLFYWRKSHLHLEWPEGEQINNTLNCPFNWKM